MTGSRYFFGVKTNSYNKSDRQYLLLDELLVRDRRLGTAGIISIK